MVLWIVKYVTTTSFSVIVNGESQGYFKRGKGLRQGDPMSPHLFNQIMKVSNLLLIRRIENSSTFQYHFGCTKLKITHVCFADDLLMFSHGDKIFVELMKDTIEEFGKVYSLLPNYNKSTIICWSVRDDDRKEILEIVPFKVEKLPISLESIHVYWATVFLLPQTVIDEINSLLKGFLWNQEEKANGRAKVKWINTYKLKGMSIWEVSEDVNDSWGWRNIMIMRQLVRKHMFKRIDDGSTTSMWFEYWTDVGILSEIMTYIDLYDARLQANMTIKEFV
ncbi:RNA-directed DNA polymerase, eukaryota, reverse transcriptase zinc-binding domain protein [Tanacetum coccineum]